MCLVSVFLLGVKKLLAIRSGLFVSRQALHSSLRLPVSVLLLHSGLAGEVEQKRNQRPLVNSLEELFSQRQSGCYCVPSLCSWRSPFSVFYCCFFSWNT